MAGFEACRIVKEFRFEVQADPEEVFPLLCPTREYDWIEGWSSELVYSESGFAENNCIFRGIFGSAPPQIYVVSRYEPEAGRIEFVIPVPDSHVEKMDIVVQGAGNGTCTVRWTRTFTGLTEAGNRLIAERAEGPLEDRMAYLGKALNHYCTTGEMLKRA